MRTRRRLPLCCAALSPTVVVISTMLSALIAASAVGCSRHGSSGEDQESRDSASAPAQDDRLGTLEGDPVGLAPGHMEGAFAYASVQASLLQAVVHELPLGERELRGFLEFNAALGFNPRVDDSLAHLGIPADARISFSVRGMSQGAEALRESLATEDVTKLSFGPTSRRGPKVEAGSTPPEPEPEPEPELAQALLDRGAALGIHLRVYLPIRDPAALEPLFAQLRSQSDGPQSRWAKLCASLDDLRLCAGGGRPLLVARDVEGGIQLDLIEPFHAPPGPASAPLEAALRRALEVPAVTLASGTKHGADLAGEVASLRGDVNLIVDGPSLVEVLRAGRISRALISLEDGRPSGAARHLREEADLARLHKTTRLYDGVRIEGQGDLEHFLAVAAWLPSSTAIPMLGGAEAFTLDEVDADVPSLAALCDGALICARSRGLPARERMRPLATGIYADPEALVEALDGFEEGAALVLALETWPNALGTLALLPGDLVEGPGSLMAESGVEVLSRVLGFGLSVRSLELDTRGRVSGGEWLGYARMTAMDLRTLGGFLQLVDIRMNPSSIPELPGRIESTPLPNSDVRGSLYSVYDPMSDTGEWGWAMIADADARLVSFAELDRDDGSTPLIYAEVSDLWRLVSSDERTARKLSIAQSWLSRRWVRAQVSLRDGAPELRVETGKRR